MTPEIRLLFIAALMTMITPSHGAGRIILETDDYFRTQLDNTGGGYGTKHQNVCGTFISVATDCRLNTSRVSGGELGGQIPGSADMRLDTVGQAGTGTYKIDVGLGVHRTQQSPNPNAQWDSTVNGSYQYDDTLRLVNPALKPCRLSYFPENYLAIAENMAAF